MEFNVIDKTEQAAGGGGVQIALGGLAQDNAGARRVAQLLLESGQYLTSVVDRPIAHGTVRWAGAGPEMPIVEPEIGGNGSRKVEKRQKPGQGEREEMGHRCDQSDQLEIMPACDSIRVSPCR